jgi:hypothetical protein
LHHRETSVRVGALARCALQHGSRHAKRSRARGGDPLRGPDRQSDLRYSTRSRCCSAVRPRARTRL